MKLIRTLSWTTLTLTLIACASNQGGGEAATSPALKVGQLSQKIVGAVGNSIDLQFHGSPGPFSLHDDPGVFSGDQSPGPFSGAQGSGPFGQDGAGFCSAALSFFSQCTGVTPPPEALSACEQALSNIPSQYLVCASDIFNVATCVLDLVGCNGGSFTIPDANALASTCGSQVRAAADCLGQKFDPSVFGQLGSGGNGQGGNGQGGNGQGGNGQGGNGQGGSNTCGSLTSCNGSCTDLTVDPNNCGSCGNACISQAAGSFCTNGSCQCAAGQMICNNSCTSVSTDVNNCGACGNSCTTQQKTVCLNGVCM